MGQRTPTRFPCTALRLKEPQVVGDFSEEGYRTKHIFLCLGSKAESEEVWEIGRSIAVLMSQEAWGEKVDSAQSGTEIMEIIEDFMDVSSGDNNDHFASSSRYLLVSFLITIK